jgi:hypothetical protein
MKKIKQYLLFAIPLLLMSAYAGRNYIAGNAIQISANNEISLGGELYNNVFMDFNENKWTIEDGEMILSGTSTLVVPAPVLDPEAANKAYVDAAITAAGGADGYIGDGGDINLPLGTYLRGFTHNTSAQNDGRLQFGDLESGSYRTGFRVFDDIGYGYNLRAIINSSGDLTDAGMQIYDRSQFGYADYQGSRIIIDNQYSYRELSFNTSLTKYHFGSGVNDWYELTENSRPAKDGSVLVTNALNGLTEWQDGANFFSAQKTNLGVGTFPTGNWTTVSSLTEPVIAGTLYEFELVVYYSTSGGSDAEGRFTLTSGTLTGGVVEGDAGTVSALAVNTPLDLPATGLNTRKTFTGYFTVSTTGTLGMEFRGVTGSANVNAATRLLIRKIN